MNRIPPLLFSLLILAACPKDDAPSTTTSNTSTSSGSTGATSTDSDASTSTGAATFEKGLTEGPTSTAAADTSTSGGDLPNDSDSTTGSGFEHSCWPLCVSDQDCDPGYICDTSPDNPDQHICAAPCVMEAGLDFPVCFLDPISCESALPLTQCLPGSVTGGPMCFPIVCINDTCIAGTCVDGFCT